MRSVLAVVALLVMVVLIADGQERKGKDAPTDESIINMVGGRLANYEADPSAGSTWDEVKARLQAKT